MHFFSGSSAERATSCVTSAPLRVSVCWRADVFAFEGQVCGGASSISSTTTAELTLCILYIHRGPSKALLSHENQAEKKGIENQTPSLYM